MSIFGKWMLNNEVAFERSFRAFPASRKAEANTLAFLVITNSPYNGFSLLSYWGVSTPKKIQLLKGFRDYLGEDALLLRELSIKVEQVFRLFGFAPMSTPTLEYAELLVGKYGPEADKLMYKFVDHGGRSVAMRYDHTVPLARAISLNQNLPLPFKRYTIAPVWRADKPQKGRLREFIQCDVDIVGSDQARADAEILAVAYQLLTSLGIKEFSLRINHRALINALVAEIHGIASTQVGAVLRVIDRFPKLGETAAKQYLVEQGLTQEQVAQLLRLLSPKLGLSGPANTALAKLRGHLKKSPATSAALDEMQAIVQHALGLGVPEAHLRLDLNVVRGLDYYTGIVMEAELAALPLFGSVLGGGRYDKLIGALTGKSTPAVGITLGLGRLFEALGELKLGVRSPAVADVLVALVDAESSQTAEQLVQTLRAKGLGAVLYLGRPGALEKQLKYADKLGVTWVVWQGPEERTKKIFVAKHLATRKQQELKLSELIKTLLVK
ncbi:MAG: histidine--tRNA ligase [Parcubacteria group bacterium]